MVTHGQRLRCILVAAVMCAVAFLLHVRSSNLDGIQGPVKLWSSSFSLLELRLQKIASHSTDSYLLEHSLIDMLQRTTSDYSSVVTTLDRVLFVVMCSNDKKERMKLLTQSWLLWIPPDKVVLLGETEVDGYNITTLPELPGDAYLNAKFPNPTNYEAANLRHLRAVQWLGRVKRGALDNVDWVLMVDDDTFVNPPMLLMLLSRIPPSLPLLLGHIWDSPPWDPHLKGLAFASGGAGMLFTTCAFQRLAVNLFEPVCDMHTFLNDVTIGFCATASNITKVHSLKFQPERVSASYIPTVQDAGSMVTVHRITAWQHALEYTCLVSKRFDRPHPMCTNISVPCDPGCHDDAPRARL